MYTAHHCSSVYNVYRSGTDVHTVYTVQLFCALYTTSEVCTAVVLMFINCKTVLCAVAVHHCSSVYSVYIIGTDINIVYTVQLFCVLCTTAAVCTVCTAVALMYTLYTRSNCSARCTPLQQCVQQWH